MIAKIKSSIVNFFIGDGVAKYVRHTITSISAWLAINNVSDGATLTQWTESTIKVGVGIIGWAVGLYLSKKNKEV